MRNSAGDVFCGVAAAAVTALLALSCGGGDKKVNAPSASAPTTTTLSSASTLKEASPSINVSDEIAKQCALRFNEVEQAPKFNFDDSELWPRDRDTLDQIAKCLTTGPLKGRDVRLVGRADPRGSIDYNLALGARRANGVASYLKHLGVGSEHLRETSRGELDATGTDEASWQSDRRVDIVLDEASTSHE